VLNHHIWDLEAVRDYPQTGRWPPQLRRLLDDPEAPLAPETETATA
jgi:hypothetical protein